MNQLLQGGIKPEPQLDHLQDTPSGLCQVGLRVGPLTGRLRVPLAWVCERAVVPYGDSMTVAWFRHRPPRVPAWVVDAG